jgi:hypothetical protein
MFKRGVVLTIFLALGIALSVVVISHGGPGGIATAGSSPSSFSSSLSSSANSSKTPIAFPPISVHRLGYAGPNTVNPTFHYTAEPAPMGIADFGVGADGQPYTYGTSEFLGNFSWKSLNLSSSGDYSFTDQLNVVVQFVQDGVTYAYWIQDVAFLDSATNQLSFENNIWNFSSTSACLNNTGVSGNGTVYAYSGCIGYYAVSPTTQPGADRTMPSPGDFALLVRSYENVHGIPEVAFEYWDGVTSWYVSYDNVVWPWAKSVSSDNNFVVDGSGYNPYGLFYDAELTIGGPGGGASTAAENPTDATSRLLYWNGNNFEAPPSVWNFGSNTAEAVSNIQSIFSSDSAGLPLTLQLNGTARNATPAQAYGQNQVGELAVSAPDVSSGTVAIPGDTWEFVNDSAKLTLVPGTYQVWVNSTSGSNDLGSCQITAGATLDVTVGNSCGSGSSGPSVSTPTASANGVDVGQSVTFRSTLLSAGSGGDTYVWNTAPTGLGCTASTSLTLSCTPTASGTYRINITVTDSDSQSATSGTLTYTVSTDPTVATPSASKSSVETGESVTFTASPTGGATPYTYSWSGLPTPCTQTTSAAPSCTPASAGTYSIKVSVTDANGYSVTSASLSFTVLSGPSVAVPSASPRSSVDLGQSATFSTTASGGTGSYTYSWSGLPAGCSSSNSPDITCTPSSTGSFSVTVTVVDSDGGTATSGALSFTVNTDPEVRTPTASPPAVDLGQSVTFSASATGGSGTYTYSWSGLPSGCRSSSSADITCTPSSVGSFSVTVTVVDSYGETATSGTLLFTVNTAPAIGTPTASPPVVDVRQSVTFSASATGGSAPYTYTWSGLPIGCSPTSSPDITCSPSSVGSFSVTVTVVDSDGATATSGVLTFTVDTAPAIGGVTDSPTTVDVGQQLNFNVTGVSGGVGPYSYAWSGLPAGCVTRDTADLACVPSGAASGKVTVTVTDENGATVSSSVSFQVFADPSLSGVSVSRASADQGQSVTFSAVGLTGGSGSYSYRWTGLPSGCQSTNTSSLVCVPSAPGGATVTLAATDSNGISVESSVKFTVYSDPAVGTPTGTPTTAQVGEAVVFSVSATDGSSSLTYVWSGLPAGCLPVNASTVTCHPSAVGTTEVTVSVTDSNGVSARSGGLEFTVLNSVSPQSSPASLLTGSFFLGAIVSLTVALIGLLAVESLRGRSHP